MPIDVNNIVWDEPTPQQEQPAQTLDTNAIVWDDAQPTAQQPTQQAPMQEQPKTELSMMDRINKYKKELGKAISEYSPMMAMPRMAAEFTEKATSDVANAQRLKGLEENYQFAFKDLKDTYDASIKGDKEAQSRLQYKKDEVNKNVVKSLSEQGIEAYYDNGKLLVVEKDEKGNETLKDLDEETLNNIASGFSASGGEIAGAIGGAIKGGVAGSKLGGLDPRKKALTGIVGAAAGGYAGATLGSMFDLTRAAIALNKDIDAKEIAEKATARGVADIIGTGTVSAAGEIVKKVASKAAEPLEKLSKKAYTLYKSGNIKGAVQVVKDDYKLTDNDIDTLFNNVSKDVKGFENLEGDDLLRAKLLAVVQQQEQGEGLITEAIKKTPKGAMETSKEIAARANEVLKYAESIGSKPSEIKNSVKEYEKAVGKNYGEVKKLISDALPDHKPDIDLTTFKSTLNDVNTRVIDPVIKEKVTNLAESLASQKIESVDDLINVRQLFNKFYGKNAAHFENASDKKALMSIQKTIDSKIEESFDTLPETTGKQLKEAFTDAKKQYEEMFKVKDTATYISIFGKKGKLKGKSEEQIGKALVRYSKAEDNDLEVVLSKLSPVQRVKSEFSIINELLSTSMGKTQAKSIDFNKLLEGINASKNTFKSNEAKQFIKNIEDFDKKFGKDVGLQKATEGVVSKEINNIATSAIGKTKMILASMQFKAIQRLAMSDEGRRLSLQKSLEMALEKSRTPSEFFFKASKIQGMPNADREALKRTVKEISNNTERLRRQTEK